MNRLDAAGTCGHPGGVRVHGLSQNPRETWGDTESRAPRAAGSANTRPRRGVPLAPSSGSLCELPSHAISPARPVCSLGLTAVLSSGADSPGRDCSPERPAHPGRFSRADLGKAVCILTTELGHLTVQGDSTSKKGERWGLERI